MDAISALVNLGISKTEAQNIINTLTELEFVEPIKLCGSIVFFLNLTRMIF